VVRFSARQATCGGHRGGRRRRPGDAGRMIEGVIGRRRGIWHGRRHHGRYRGAGVADAGQVTGAGVLLISSFFVAVATASDAWALRNGQINISCQAPNEKIF
jgi:hypothetical protein